jgi:arylsulfatase A-like enzyme
MTLARCRGFALSAALLLWGPAVVHAQSSQNVLLIIADDVGVDGIGAYQPLVGSNDVPATPTIDDLAAEGVLFRNAWSNPVCGATRATMQTGRYGHRTGIRTPITNLIEEEFTIPELIARDATLDRAAAIVGKWGLNGGTGTRHAVRAGYDYFAGRPGCCLTPPAGSSYFAWEKHSAGFQPGGGCDPDDPAWHANDACIYATVEPLAPPEPPTVYASAVNVEDALAWVAGLPAGQPWFLVLAFNSAHSPYHQPPGGPVCSDDESCYRAMITDMDGRISDMLAGLGPAVEANTTVFFVGDNGNPGLSVFPYDPDRSKFTLFQGGVNVPLIVKGAAVAGSPGRVSEALVNTSDLFMTVLELAGANPATFPTTIPKVPSVPWDHDSFSLVPILQGTTDQIRHFAYAENGSAKAIRNRAGFKIQMIRVYVQAQLAYEPRWYFYDLTADPYENANLVDEVSGELVTADPLVQAQLDDLKLRLGDPNGPTSVPLPPNLPAANRDLDADGVAEDGDGSGTAGDAPCGDGEILGCDDNCAATPNPEQGDVNANGIGNACDAACANALDDDGDGWVDYPADPACPSSAATSEQQNCQDGVDNDSDGRKDFDGGQSIFGACSGGVCPPGVSDVDADGIADADPGCAGPADNSEQNHCGLGAELVLLTPLLARLQRRRMRPIARPAAPGA